MNIWLSFQLSIHKNKSYPEMIFQHKISPALILLINFALIISPGAEFGFNFLYGSKLLVF
jgi:hypothetical protein